LKVKVGEEEPKKSAFPMKPPKKSPDAPKKWTVKKVEARTLQTGGGVCQGKIPDFFPGDPRKKADGNTT